MTGRNCSPAMTGVRVLLVIVGLLMLPGWHTIVHAQAIELTPEQRRMLNQLPPSQRRQAQQALEELNRQRSGSRPQTGISEDLSTMPQPPSPDAAAAQGIAAVPEEPRAEAQSRLIISFQPRDDLSRQETAELEEDLALQQIRGSNYYALDESGVLALPGLPDIPLLGLRARDIEQRLGAEDALSVFDIRVSILDEEATGAAALEPYGYEVFEPSDSGFEPVTTGPVPPDYVLGPGDTVRIQFFGNVNRTEDLEVSRDGELNLPELGPMSVAGQQFSAFREDLNRRVQEMLIGTQLSVSMGQLRTIRIFVMGDANRPGSYVVSSLATISSALYYSRGISEIGSLRNIQLKRGGKVVTTLDLYDFLLRGDTSEDYRLQPGDVIFVPPIGETIGVAGAVRRPAIYELKGAATVEDAISLAGGMLPEAFPGAARLERISDERERTVVSLDAGSAQGASTPLRSGDTLTIPKVLQEYSDSVVLEGHVQRPGPYEWRPGMRLADLLPSAQHLKPGADTNYVLIRREDPVSREVEAVSASLRSAWRDPASQENVRLQPRDTIHVFDLAFGRQRVISPILEELELQARRGEPHKVVNVTGQVRAPGSYPLEPEMRVSDLIRAGGDLTEAAYTLQAELTRYEIIGEEHRAAEVIEIDLDSVLEGDAEADLLLSEHDYLRIDSIPHWDSEWTVSLEGEILYPGEYRIRRGETLKQVLDRAGGLTIEAFPEGAVFLRESLREREQEQIDALVRRLETDLASLSLQMVETSGSDTLSTGRALLNQLRETEAVGRLVINLEDIVADNADAQRTGVQLRDGDRLLVPKRSQVVTVIGEVQQSTSHLFGPNLSRDDYLDMSGGTTRRADEKLIYVVRANGAVVTGGRSRWFGRSSGTDIRPGDTIVVPLETDRIRPLTFWGSVTQILYQGAIAISAIRTFDN